MRKTPKNAVAIAESNEKEITLNKITALMKGTIKDFKHRDLIVRRSGHSIQVANEDGESLGGYMLIDSASVKEVYGWVEAKIEYYGEA